MVQLLQTTRPLNPLLINALRHAPRPVNMSVLGAIYADESHLVSDVRVLVAKGLIQESTAGLTWAGS